MMFWRRLENHLNTVVFNDSNGPSLQWICMKTCYCLFSPPAANNVSISLETTRVTRTNRRLQHHLDFCRRQTRGLVVRFFLWITNLLPLHCLSYLFLFTSLYFHSRQGVYSLGTTPSFHPLALLMTSIKWWGMYQATPLLRKHSMFPSLHIFRYYFGWLLLQYKMKFISLFSHMILYYSY